MKRPLVAVVSFYIIGLLLAELCRPRLEVLFAVSFFLFALAFAFKRFRPLFLCVLLGFAGWINLIIHETIIAPDDLRNLIGDKTEIVSIRGTLEQTPQIKISERNNEETERSIAQIRVSEIQQDDRWQTAAGKIVVVTPAPMTNFFAGQNIEIIGVVSRPPLPLAEGLFDARGYFQTRGIFYQLKTTSVNDWRYFGSVRQLPPLTDRFLGWSKQTLAIGLPQDGVVQLLWAMTLGWRTAFTGDVGDPFLRAGTMHLFAIDGLRIALISGMLVALLRVLQLSRAWCGAIAIPVIWFYTAATGWESSAIRASVMMTIVLGGWALKRPGDLLNSLAAAAFLILLWEPRQLFEASFQLSFFVMLTIGLMLPKLNNFTDRLLQHDPFLPDELVPKWRRSLIWISRILARYFSLSLAAWLGSIPLSALYFHLFSPISPVANLIAVPLGTFALMANFGALICGGWFPLATELFNNAAWFFMSAMQWVSVESTKIPGSYFYVPSPSWISIGIYYAVLIVGFSGWLRTMPRKTFFALALAVFAAIYFCRWESSRAGTDITVLPLNGGHAVFVDADGRKNDWLIDCGDRNAVNFTLKNFLRAQGVNQIPRLVLTEGESRNCSGAELLSQNFEIGELWTSSVHFRSGIYNEIVLQFEESNRHKIFNCGGQIGMWKILWPSPADDSSRADDNALVMLGSFSGARILLLSDLSRIGQSKLLSRTNDLRADIVVAGLPVEGEPLSDSLVDAIQPKIIIVADSDFPASRRANPALKDRLAQRQIPVIYTRDSGAVKIVAGKTWKVQAMDGQKFSSVSVSK